MNVFGFDSNCNGYYFALTSLSWDDFSNLVHEYQCDVVDYDRTKTPKDFAKAMKAKGYDIEVKYLEEESHWWLNTD